MCVHKTYDLWQLKKYNLWNVSFQDLANGQFDILFYPSMAIPHKLDIKYNGLPVTTSPMEAKVTLRWLKSWSQLKAHSDGRS